MLAMAKIGASNFLNDCTVWSSTKYAPNDVFYVSLKNGYVGGDCDERNNSVLAFAFVQKILHSKRDFWTGKKANEVCFFPCFFLDNLVKYDNDISTQETAVFPRVSSSESKENLRYTMKFKEDNFIAGDIVVWDGEQKRVIAQEGFFLSDKYTPIGVVVIPASHMDDGRARMMATRWMSCDDPENGSVTGEFMVWGTATDLTGLTNFTQVPVIARYDDDGQGGVTALTVPQEIYTVNGYAFLPSNYPNWTGEPNPEDPGTRWRQSSTYWNDSVHTSVSANNFYAPSPYAADGTPNLLYRATSYSGGSINNVLSYFDGRHQSDVILAARGAKDYDSWKPTNNVPEDFPAVSVCDMYHTVGTSQGDWYLPSQAELGYVIARLNDINNALTKVNGMQALPSFSAWSSSEYGSSHARRPNFLNGYVYHWYLKERYLYPVVAFSLV